MDKVLFLYTDGGSRNNPGPAAVGVLLMDKEKVLEKLSKYIGVATNNEAEYAALLEGLKLAVKYKPSRLVCYLDSQLVVKQLNGVYKVKEMRLQRFVLEIKRMEKNFEQVSYKYIPRKYNSIADSLVNRALDINAES